MNDELSINADKNKISLENNASDYATSALKVLFGGAPYIGSVLEEIVGLVIPNQKMDRVKLFAEVLDQKLRYIEKDVLENKMKTEEFTDLLEDAFLQASRALTDERREYIASILKNSLTNEALDHIGDKKLLSILNELNDAEIIFLRYEGLDHYNQDEFYPKHETVLSPIPAAMNSPQSEHDKNYLRENYNSKLKDSGLLKPKFRRLNKGEIPEFDDVSGGRKVSTYNLSGLGRLFLRYIDHPADQDMDEE